MSSGLPVLSRRALGRATLHRQLLLERADISVVDAVRRLVGLQAQVPTVPYVGLWSRLVRFDPERLATPTHDRQVVRSPLMRTTLHLVTSDDALLLRPLVQAVLARTFRSTAWGQALRRAGIDPDEVAAAGHALTAEAPRTRAELAAALGEAHPGQDPTALAMATTYLVPLVQTTPRGLWGQSGQATWAPTERWLDRPLTAGGSREDLVLRYLAAFGPASVADVQAWCGLTRLREVADGLGERLRRYRSEGGGLLLDLADAPLPDPDQPAPVRFLPEYDNALLSYADRSRVIGDEQFHLEARAPGSGHVGTVLVDGLVRAGWVARREGDRTVLQVTTSSAVTAAQRGEIATEGARLLDLLAPGADRDVRVSSAAAS